MHPFINVAEAQSGGGRHHHPNLLKKLDQMQSQISNLSKPLSPTIAPAVPSSEVSQTSATASQDSELREQVNELMNCVQRTKEAILYIYESLQAGSTPEHMLMLGPAGGWNCD